MTWLPMRLGVAMLAVLISMSAQAGNFVVAGYALSDHARTTSSEGWDETGTYWTRNVLKGSAEPFVSYSVTVSSGKLNEPPTERHKLSVLATDEDKAYLIDFENAPDSGRTFNDPDFLQWCPAEAKALGTVARTLKEFSMSGGVEISIILDEDMPEDARTQSRRAIDAWMDAWSVELSTKEQYDLRHQGPAAGELTKSLAFKRLALALGPRFRGAIVACGRVGDFARPIWQTRYLDLPLASTVFNLNPQ